MKAVITLILTIMAMGAYAMHAEAQNTPITFYQVAVGYGETIWDVAARNTKPGEDIREQVWWIMKDNDIQNERKVIVGTVLNLRERT